MKKLILINLILLSFTLIVNAQWQGSSPLWTNSNVGIGTSNPTYRLSIVGTTAASSSLQVTSFNGTGYGYPPYIDFRGAKGSESSPSVVALNDKLGQFMFWGYKDAGSRSAEWVPSAAFGALVDNNPVTEHLVKAALIFYTNGTGDYSVDPQERMRITSGGLVGIGTTTPKEKLEVAGRTKATQGFYATGFLNPASSSNLKAIDLSFNASSNVGYIRCRDWSAAAWLPIEFQASIFSFNNKVKIGTKNPSSSDYKLAVDGKIVCGEVKVEDVATWSDFVFANDYKLKTLAEVETFIAKNKHLPDVPSEAQVKANGYDVS